jgi:D-sedoheptulose 7-phosphate isomerase
VAGNSASSAKANGDVPGTQAYFERLAKLIPVLPYADIDAIAGVILDAFAEDHTVFVFGNGGSAASASHAMVDLNKGTIAPGPVRRMKVMALTDNVPLLTAWANDASYEQVFSEQLKNFVRKGDVAFAISASGNSPNVLLALEIAREHGAIPVGVAGYQGGKMKQLCDLCVVVPCDHMQMIEDMHHAILHSIFTMVREGLHSGRPLALTAAAGRFPK